MARRHLRTFTLSEAVSRVLDDLATEGSTSPRVQALVAQEEVYLDKYDLRAKDYEELYALLPSKTPGTKLPRNLDGNTFMLHLTQYGEVNTALHGRLLQEMNRRMKINRAATKPPPINASRIADALLSLGFATLCERVSAGERHQGSTAQHVSEGGHKLPVGKGRKGAAV